MQDSSQKSELLDFFKEGKNLPFEELPTSIITGRIDFPSACKIDQRILFENIDVYNVPGYERPKRIKVDLPHPGIPFVILSARMGSEVKGIIKNRKVLTEKKGKLSERLSFDFSIDRIILNIMVYPNMIKISGGKNRKHLAQAFVFFRSLLLMIQKRGVNVYSKMPIATKIHVDMVNVPFDLGYSVNKKLMERVFRENDKFSHLPPEEEELKICYEMGINKKSGEKRYYRFRIRHSGKIHFTGDDRGKMEHIYNHFMKIVNAHQDHFRFN